MNISKQYRTCCYVSPFSCAPSITRIPFSTKRRTTRAARITSTSPATSSRVTSKLCVSAFGLMSPMTLSQCFSLVPRHHQVVWKWKPRFSKPVSRLFVSFKEVIDLEYAHQSLVAFSSEVLPLDSDVRYNIPNSQSWSEHAPTTQAGDYWSGVFEVRLPPNRTVDKRWYVKLFTCINTRLVFYKRVIRVEIQVGHVWILCEYEPPSTHFSESGLRSLSSDFSSDPCIEGGLGGLACSAGPKIPISHQLDDLLHGHAFNWCIGHDLYRCIKTAEFDGFGRAAHRRVFGLCGVLRRSGGRGRFLGTFARRGLWGVRVGSLTARVRFLRDCLFSHAVCSFQSSQCASNTDHEGLSPLTLQGQCREIRKLFGGSYGRYA